MAFHVEGPLAGMKRRRVLAAATAGLGTVLAGCADVVDSPLDDDAPSTDDGDRADDAPADDTTGGDPSIDDWEPHAPSGADVPGRIDPLGHVLDEVYPFYTFGDVSPDGEWAVMGAFGVSEHPVSSTLVDLANLADPTIVHHLERSNDETRSNDVKLDGHRDGLYYRSMEANDRDGADPEGGQGIEVIDFGWGEGSPTDPVVLARLETPDRGVHKLTTHPEESLLYLVDVDGETDVGVRVVDVTEPADPEILSAVGPPGACHDVEYDPVREVLHAAYIDGEAEGYVIYDAADPVALEPIGQFRYDDRPGYATLGEPGFERCHQADYDPERGLAVIGDETGRGIPGGKHVFDIGWDEGSLTDPVPIGFTHSPDAREMGHGETFWWTTHFHDVVPMDGETLLIDGGYRQGVWVCNLTDPREPIPTERYATVRGADAVPDIGDETPGPSTPPFAWGAVYNEARDVVFATDSLTGGYTFELTTEPARGERGRGPDGHYDLEAVLTD